MPRYAPLVVFLVAFFTYAWFAPRSGSNGASRLALARAIVEEARLEIDTFYDGGIDRAVRGGHVYSDKAPGASFLVVPALAVYELATEAIDDAPETALAGGSAHMYVSSLVASALPGAATAALLLVVAMRLGAPATRALFATAGLALGTTFFSYSTVFFGHVLCGALLFASFALLAGERGRVRPRTSRAVLAGLAAAFAVVVEYPAAVPAGLILLYGWHATSWRVAPPFLAAALAPGLLLALYNAAAFGGPLQTGYSHLVEPRFREGMASGFMGIGAPDFVVLVKILVGPRRGLVPLAPVLVLALTGWRGMWRTRERRPELALSLAVAAFYGLLNASYFLWDGGWSMGPRHVVPMLPFLALPIAFGEGRVRPVELALLALSVVIATAAAAVGPLVETRYENTLLDFILPRIAAGDLEPNLGLGLGLPGLVSLAPLPALWAVAGWLLLRGGADARPAGQ